MKIEGGHRFNLKHGPKDHISLLDEPDFVGLSIRGFLKLKPKILVKEGDLVFLGQALIEDKYDSRIRFCSPASGSIHKIEYGPRRVLEAVIVKIDPALEKDNEKNSLSDLKDLTASKIYEELIRFGIWPLIDHFPKKKWAPLPSISECLEERKIAAVHVNLLKTDVHSADPLKIIERSPELFLAGCAVLKILAPLRAYIKKGADKKLIFSDHFSDIYQAEAKYPAHDLGVQAYYQKSLLKNECIIGVDAEIVKDIGSLFLKGKFRKERIYSLSGSAVREPKLFEGRVGIAVGDLVSEALKDFSEVRLIAGNLFTGSKVKLADFLAPKETGIIAMEEDTKRIPLSFFRLGFDRLSIHKTWGSRFLSDDSSHEATTNNNGEERACIQCGYCIDICPVKLLPNLLMKAAKDKDIEKMEKLFINDCVDCGLCTFTCPAKIELGREIALGKQLLEKEG